jgi:hypothetical protein
MKTLLILIESLIMNSQIKNSIIVKIKFVNKIINIVKIKKMNLNMKS